MKSCDFCRSKILFLERMVALQRKSIIIGIGYVLDTFSEILVLISLPN